MNWMESISITTALLVLFLVILPITIAIYLYFYDRSQKQHAILTEFPDFRADALCDGENGT